MKIREKKKILEAHDDLLQAEQELLAYIEQVEIVLDLKNETLTPQDLKTMKARSYELRSIWRSRVFDFLAVSNCAPEEIRRIMLVKKKR